MEYFDLIYKVLSLLFNLFGMIHTVYQDKKKAAATRNSDGDATL